MTIDTDKYEGKVTMIVNPNDDHNQWLYVTIEFPDGEVYRGYVEKISYRTALIEEKNND